MPPNQIAGPVTVWVVLNSIAGPQVSLTLQDAAPALFPWPLDAGYAIAQQWPAYSSIAPASPVGDRRHRHPLRHRTGKDGALPGAAHRNPHVRRVDRADGCTPAIAGRNASSTPRGPVRRHRPRLAGLYQIDLALPENAGPNPEIRVAIGSRMSPGRPEAGGAIGLSSCRSGQGLLPATQRYWTCRYSRNTGSDSCYAAEMKRSVWLRSAAVAAVCVSAMWAFQRPFREYPGQEYDDFPFPPTTRRKPNSFSRG